MIQLHFGDTAAAHRADPRSHCRSYHVSVTSDADVSKAVVPSTLTASLAKDLSVSPSALSIEAPDVQTEVSLRVEDSSVSLSTVTDTTFVRDALATQGVKVTVSSSAEAAAGTSTPDEFDKDDSPNVLVPVLIGLAALVAVLFVVVCVCTGSRKGLGTKIKPGVQDTASDSAARPGYDVAERDENFVGEIPGSLNSLATYAGRGQWKGPTFETGTDAEEEEAARLQDFEGKFDIRWPSSGLVKQTEVKDGCFDVFGSSYTLLDTKPVSFEWSDGTVQTVKSFSSSSSRVLITWTTTHDGGVITWTRDRSKQVREDSDLAGVEHLCAALPSTAVNSLKMSDCHLGPKSIAIVGNEGANARGDHVVGELAHVLKRW